MKKLFLLLPILGLLGRASSALPTSCTWSEEAYSNGKPDESESGTDKLGPYTYDSYGALKKADGSDYSYITITPSSDK